MTVNTIDSAIVIALIAGVVAIVSALLASASAAAARRSSRTEQIELQLARALRDRQLLYLWNRELVDHIYTGKPPPAPDPPAGIFTD